MFIRQSGAIARCAATSFIAVTTAVAIVGSPTLTTAATLTSTVYVMGGTFQPLPKPDFVDRSVTDFVIPTVGGDYAPADRHSLYAPEQAFPFSAPELGIYTVNQSVAEGVDLLTEAMAAEDSAQPYVVFGYSQSTVITMKVKADLIQRQAAGQDTAPVTFVGIGVGNRPNGGITTRLQGVRIPFFDFTMNGPASTDDTHGGVPTIDIVREYDGLADFPLYPLNLMSTLNALLGVVFVHGRYDQVSLDPASPRYVPGTHTEVEGDTTYYTIPTPNLPIFDVARIIGIPEQLIDIVEPAARVLVEAGYDRSIPFGTPTRARLIPQVDLAKFVGDLGVAIAAGLRNAVEVLQDPAVLLGGNPHQRDVAGGLIKWAGDAGAAVVDALGSAIRKALQPHASADAPIVAAGRSLAPLAASEATRVAQSVTARQPSAVELGDDGDNADMDGRRDDLRRFRTQAPATEKADEAENLDDAEDGVRATARTPAMLAEQAATGDEVPAKDPEKSPLPRESRRTAGPVAPQERGAEPRAPKSGTGTPRESEKPAAEPDSEKKPA